MGAVTIETITVTRPMKVIAFTACTITVFLMIGACSTSDWVTSEGWHEGLFKQCATNKAYTPMSFGDLEAPGCTRAHKAGYVRGCAALIIIVCFTDFFGTLLTGLGLRSTDPNKKYKYYRVAIYSLIVALIALFLALIIYPVSFSKEMATVPPLNGGMLTYPKNLGDMDFDNDGILDHIDNDDDNDGIPDDEDNDDDNDGIVDEVDDDDDNDGIKDSEDGGDADFDNDGTPDAVDNDDDNDGIPDHLDNDDDNDGIADHLDNDDDNDGIIDSLEDGDDDDDDDDDDDEEPEFVSAEELDDDNDGIPNILDGDDDNDGITDDEDPDDDNDGIPDELDMSGVPRVWSFGFGYGAAWASCIFIFLSVILLICDRESEEIFYKERPADEEEGGEED